MPLKARGKIRSRLYRTLSAVILHWLTGLAELFTKNLLS